MIPAALATLLMLGDGRLPLSLDDEPSRGSAALVLRFGVPDGDLGPVDYDDLFDLGLGVGLELDYLIDADLGWSFGPYVGVDAEWFSGQEESVGPFRVDADDLVILNALVGFKGAVRVDPALRLELRVGVGLSHFFSTEGDVEGGPSIDLLDASTEIAGETGLRAVFEPRSALTFEFGGAFRLRGSAEEGEDAPLDADSMLEYVLELGVGCRF